MITAIIPAAGQGRRMQVGKNKAYLTILGQPILVRSALALSNCPEVDNLIVVVAEGEVEAAKKILSGVPGLKPWEIVIGGSERQHSIANALRVVSPESTMILVHDAARPLIDSNDVSRLIAAVRMYKAAGIAVPVKDTIKVADEDAFAIQTPRRDTLWSIQTPQGFEARLLRDAYTKASAENFCGTDDASLVERLGVRVKLVQGSYQNIKVTTPEDILIAEAFLQQGGISINRMPRVGMGYDVHAFQVGRKLILGGVEVPYEMGLLGHSDADVLLHAIKDALLGAAGLGDIGRHFPDTDPKYKGVSSLLLLARVKEILSEYSYNVINIDATVVAQKPKLAAYIQQMNANIAQTLNMDIRQVNVKATTTEGLGFTGRKEGIAAYAVVSIVAQN